jgi:hypothetical protein
MARSIAFVLSAIISLLIIERGQKSNNKVIELSIIQVLLALSATVSALLIRESIYSTYISGDELAYLSNSSFHTQKLASMLGNIGSENTSSGFIGMLTLQKMSSQVHVAN